MKILDNFSVGVKITTGYIIALALMLVVGGLAIYRLNEINETVNVFAYDLAHDQRLADDILGKIMRARLYGNKYIRKPNEEDLKIYQQEYKEIAELLAEADQHIIDPHRVQLLATIKASYTEYGETFDEIALLLNERHKIVQDELDVQGPLAQEKLDTLYENAFKAEDAQAVYHIGKAQEGVALMRLDAFKYLEEGDEQWIDKLEKGYDQAMTAFDSLETELQNPTQRRLAAEARDATETYHQAFSTIHTDYARQNSLIETTLDPAGANVRTTADEMSTDVATDFDADAKAADNLVNETMMLLFVFMGVAVVVGLGLGIALSRAITTPLGQVAGVAQLLAAGDLSEQVIVTSRDEVGVLASAFNKMIAYQRQMAEAATRLAGGDVATEVTPQSAKDVLGNAFGQMIVYQRQMADAATRLAGGDVAIEVTPQSAKDVLGNAFSQMIDYQQAIAGAATRLAEGDVTVKVTPKSANDMLGNAVSRMVENLHNLVGQMQYSAEQVAEASRQLNSAAEQTGQASQQVSSSIQQMAKGAGEQAEAVTSVTSNVEQMARSSEGIARGAQEQAASVQKTADLISTMTRLVEEVEQITHAVTGANGKMTQAARHGVAAVGQTGTGMETIRTRTATAAIKVKEMGQRSKEIGRIVETIDDIADKTDMLALNAAVEAARAGEHGRGFAVVADQVRKLSEDSKEATRDIGQLIERVQETVNEAIASMESTVTEVDNGSKLAGDTARSLEDILHAAEDAAEMAQKIGKAIAELRTKSEGVNAAAETVSAVVEENTAVAEEMAASSRDVTTAMEGIASVAEENSAASEEVSALAEEMSAQVEEMIASSEELSALAEELREVAAQFQIEQQEPTAWRRDPAPHPHHGNGHGLPPNRAWQSAPATRQRVRG